ncbi:MAG: DHHW family protein [Hungatella sp.]
MNQNRESRIFVIGFLGFLAAASLWSAVIPKQSFSASENRYLQQKPEFTIEGLLDGSFGRTYETYLSDQFPARNAWIGMKVYAERLQGKKDVNGVYFGEDDYLIEKFDTEDIEGELADKNRERLETFVARARDALGEDHVRVMLVPTASQILTEKLPLLAAPYDQARVSETLMADLGGEVVIPIEEVLRAHREEAIFYRTDHHWTALGAYYGYRAWTASMGLTPWEPKDFAIHTVSEDFLGTIYSKVNIAHPPDSIQLYVPKVPTHYEIYYDASATPAPMYRYQALETKDQYAVYLDGNHGLTEIYNAGMTEGSDRKLLIIKDSFAHSFAPFAANHFSETYLIDLRYFNQNPAQFMQEKGITDLLILYQIPGFAREKTVSKIL